MFHIIVVIGVLQTKNNLKPLDDTVVEAGLSYVRFMADRLVISQVLSWLMCFHGNDLILRYYTLSWRICRAHDDS